jgi:hypothetical protein
MNVNFSLAGCAAIAAVGIFAAGAAAADGRIKICRIALPGADKETQYIPADGTYGGACDANGDNCRKIVVAVTAGTHLKAGQSCVELNAVLVQSDGQPLVAGQKLIPNWDTGTFESNTVVTKSFN